MSCGAGVEISGHVGVVAKGYRGTRGAGIPVQGQWLRVHCSDVQRWLKASAIKTIYSEPSSLRKGGVKLRCFAWLVCGFPILPSGFADALILCQRGERTV